MRLILRPSLGAICSDELPEFPLSTVRYQDQTELPKPDLKVKVPNHQG